MEVRAALEECLEELSDQLPPTGGPVLVVQDFFSPPSSGQPWLLLRLVCRPPSSTKMSLVGQLETSRKSVATSPLVSSLLPQLLVPLGTSSRTSFFNFQSRLQYRTSRSRQLSRRHFGASNFWHTSAWWSDQLHYLPLSNSEREPVIFFLRTGSFYCEIISPQLQRGLLLSQSTSQHDSFRFSPGETWGATR